MALCRELSTKGEGAAKFDSQRMIHYSVAQIKAHGNRLATDINADGGLIEADLSYTEPFDDASSSIKRLYELSETVPVPRFSDFDLKIIKHNELDVEQRKNILKKMGAAFQTKQKGLQALSQKVSTPNPKTTSYLSR